MSTNVYISKLLDLMRQEEQIYKSMIGMCTEERTYIVDGDMSNLNVVLANKQECLRRIAMLERDADSYKKYWCEKKSVLPETSRREVESFFAGFKALIKQLMDIEDENERLLDEYTQRRQHKVAQVKRGKQLSNAYAPAGAAQPRYMNQRK